MRSMLNVMRAQAVMAGQGRQSSKLGVVSAYDPYTYSIKAQFPPDESETGWIPLGALAVGPGWGVYAGPVIGDQIEVHFQDGGADAGIAGLRMFDNQSPPLAVPSGEIWVVHKSGAFFKLTNDGKASFSDSKGGFVTLNGDGTVTSGGAWTHQGSLTVQQDLDVAGNSTVGGITSNGHDIGSTHQHINSGGSGLGGIPQ